MINNKQDNVQSVIFAKSSHSECASKDQVTVYYLLFTAQVMPQTEDALILDTIRQLDK